MKEDHYHRVQGGKRRCDSAAIIEHSMDRKNTKKYLGDNMLPDYSLCFGLPLVSVADYQLTSMPESAALITRW